jgi:tRNA threonylcarbamoyl adenosine modification protein YeaZ
MRILSFDTSSSALHLALLEGREVYLAREIDPTSINRQEIGSNLVPEIDHLMKDAGWLKSSVDLVVVGIGPGSFTGIRVAVVTGRSIAQALELPLIGVSYLETIGSQLDPPGAVVIDSGKEFFFAAGYERSESVLPREKTQAAYVDKEQLLQLLDGYEVTYADAKAQTKLPDHQCRALPNIKNIASAQAQLAVDRLSLEGYLRDQLDARARLTEHFHWKDVLPLYLRSPSVTIKKNYGNSDSPANNR